MVLALQAIKDFVRILLWSLPMTLRITTDCLVYNTNAARPMRNKLQCLCDMACNFRSVAFVCLGIEGQIYSSL